VDVDAIAVGGEWIRHVPHRSALLGRSEQRTDGRWQHASVVRGLYLADESATATAEWYRWLAERGLLPAQAIPHDHHIWQLNLQLADLSSLPRLAAVALPAPQPSQGTWPAFQAVGDALWQLGWPGLLAPSAARPRSLIACIFDDGEWPPTGARPLRSVTVSDVPAPPTGMIT
jgi:RES domain-containing protein